MSLERTSSLGRQVVLKLILEKKKLIRKFYICIFLYLYIFVCVCICACVAYFFLSFLVDRLVVLFVCSLTFINHVVFLFVRLSLCSLFRFVDARMINFVVSLR
jgi:hypothetical protein